MPWTTQSVSTPGFVADHASVDRNTGRQIDWETVDAARANDAGNKVIHAGTVMAQQEDGTLVPRADAAGLETATCILETAAEENSRTDSLSGYGCIVGGVIYANLLPDAEDEDFGDWQGELNAAGVGHFVWETYEDSREVAE